VKKKLMLLGIALIMCMGVFSACANYGKMYTLQEAYDLGFLTTEDLMDISYHRHGVVLNEDYEEIEYTPTKTPETLSPKTENEIKRAVLAHAREAGMKDVKIEDIEIRAYYGTYNDCVAVRIRQYWHGVSLFDDEVIGGIMCKDLNKQLTLIWKK